MDDVRTTSHLTAAEMRCRVLTGRQHGVLSRNQALNCGMKATAIRHRVRAGRWIIVHPGVYLIAGSPSTWLTTLSSASLWASDRSAISHRSAAFLWEIDGVTGKVLELSSVKNLRARPHMIVHRSASLARWDVTTKNGITCTKPTRTLIDLAAVVSTRLMERAMEDCLRRNLTAVPVLRRALDDLGTRGRSGASVLSRLLEERLDRTESALEVDLSHLIRDSDLPEPVPQFRIIHGGRLVARPDFAYPSAKVAVEAHSFRWHSSRERWSADVRRTEQLNGLGWTVVQVTHDDIQRRRLETIERIRAQLFPRLEGFG
jgi:very-short-patch-repair endonuclease